MYTPPYLARFILDAVGYVPSAAIDDWRILDPACGTGVFLEQALRCLATRLEATIGSTKRPAARRRFLDVAKRCLVGVDLDANACALARETLARAASAIVGVDVPTSTFESSVIHADFLSGASPTRPVLGTFSVIVGNPPYVATTRLSAEVKDTLRRRFHTASGRIDLYVLFFERAVSLLEPKGRLGFITPDKFLTSRSAKPLRDLLRAKGAIRLLARFDSHKVFRGAATVPCVTIFEKNATQGTIELLSCAPEEMGSGFVAVEQRGSLSAAALVGPAWSINHAKTQQLAAAIRGVHPSLAEVTQRVSAGIATGRDGVFVLDDEAVTSNGIESNLLRRAVRGRDVCRYQIAEPGLHVLVPYEFRRQRGRTELVKLANLSDYPNARRYLASHRVELEKRHCVRTWGKTWYDLHDPVPADLTRVPKICVPDIADRNRFAFDPGAESKETSDQGVVPLHSVYYIVPTGLDPRYLTVVLNSRPLEFILRTSAPRVKDGFSRYRRQFLLALPIPIGASDVTRRIVRAHDRGAFADADAMAVALFGLSKRESATLDQVLEEMNTVPEVSGRTLSRPSLDD